MTMSIDLKAALLEKLGTSKFLLSTLIKNIEIQVLPGDEAILFTGEAYFIDQLRMKYYFEPLQKTVEEILGYGCEINFEIVKKESNADRPGEEKELRNELEEKAVESYNEEYQRLIEEMHYWQYTSNPSNFTSMLFSLFHKADVNNKRRLARGFPLEAAAYQEWYECGSQDAFFAKYGLKWPYRYRRKDDEC